jgi:hypothetical protein
MRVFLLSVVLLFSFPSFAKFGWSYRLVFVGYSYNLYSAAVPAVNGFSISYERDGKSCLRKRFYRGYQFHYYRDKNYVQYHGELNLSPWRRMRIALSRKSNFQFTTDLHLINSTNKSSDKYIHNLYVAPGLGVDFVFHGPRPHCFKVRASWQYNYSMIAGGNHHHQFMFSFFTGIDITATKRLVNKFRNFKLRVPVAKDF